MRPSLLLERALFTLGALSLGVYAWAMADGWLAQRALAHRLATLRAHGGATAAATRREARGSGLVGRIEIPRLHVDAVIVEGTSSRALRHGVGHVERTAFPGERGNVGLAAHRDTYFRRLRGIARGDLIRVQTPDGSFTYRVSAFEIVKPSRGDLLNPTPQPALTLVTCYPFDWVGNAPDRFVVRAEAVAATRATPRARNPAG